MNLKCYPICKCGYVFKKLESYEKLVEVSKTHSKLIRLFEPSCCPQCNEVIEKITAPIESYFGVMSFDYDKDNEGWATE